MGEKFEKMVNCLDKWLNLRECGISLNKYFRDRDVNSVGIYGYGRLGRHLVWEIETEDIQISWIMDKRYALFNERYKGYVFLSPDEITRIEDVDMIIVTALEDYYDIESIICKHTSIEVVSIEEILNAM